MRSSFALLGGLALLLAACGPMSSGGPVAPAGNPPTSSGTIAPIQGQDDAGLGNPTSRNMTRP